MMTLRFLEVPVVVAFTSFESSNTGTSGKEGRSFCSSASMRRHILDGVSRRAIFLGVAIYLAYEREDGRS